MRMSGADAFVQSRELSIQRCTFFRWRRETTACRRRTMRLRESVKSARTIRPRSPHRRAFIALCVCRRPADINSAGQARWRDAKLLVYNGHRDITQLAAVVTSATTRRTLTLHEQPFYFRHIEITAHWSPLATLWHSLLHAVINATLIKSLAAEYDPVYEQ